jgi:hypothetical protein
VRLPLRLGASIDTARQTVLGAVEDFAEDTVGSRAKLVVDELTESAAWLALSVRLPEGREVTAVAAELRERALVALAREQLLPGT